jgi:hypothetical protein
VSVHRAIRFQAALSDVAAAMIRDDASPYVSAICCAGDTAGIRIVRKERAGRRPQFI